VILADVTELLRLCPYGLPEGGLTRLDGERLDRICGYLHDAAASSKTEGLEEHGTGNEEYALNGHLRKTMGWGLKEGF
jgi:hypothetical protein